MILGGDQDTVKGQHIPMLNSGLKGVGSVQVKTRWMEGEGKQRDYALSGCSVALLASLQHVSRIKFGDPRSSGSLSEQKHAYSAPEKRTHRYQQENQTDIPRNGSFR